MKKLFKTTWHFITFPFRVFGWILSRVSWWIRNTFQEIRTFFDEETEDAPVAEALNKVIEDPSGVLFHLNALRRHLTRSVVFLVITTAFSFLFFQQILDFLARPLPGGAESLVAIEVTEPIGTVMRVSLLAGFAIAFPYIALELWMFVAPGLSRRSRLFGLAAIPVALLFFLGGMAFAYFVMLPTALPFMLNFMGIQTIPRPSSYVKFATSLLFWIGIAFEFPLVIYILAKVGLVKANQLSEQWRLAIVIIALISALITPTVDPVNMGLVMLPLVGLYFLSILLARLAQRSQVV